jgi:propanol-preferring alcohol dehydrogenase
VTRADAQAFIALAGEIPIRSEVEVHDLALGNEALRRIESGAVAGAAVLRPARGAAEAPG